MKKECQCGQNGEPADGPKDEGGDIDFDFNALDFGGGSGAQGGNTSFRDLFRQFFPSRRGATEEPEHEPGGDLEYQIEIDSWDAVRGAVKKLTITRLNTCQTCRSTGAIGSRQTCPTCHGSGTLQQAAGKMKFNVPCTQCGGAGKIRDACSICGGKGRLRRTETIDVRIPAGVAGGSRVRVTGEGNVGSMGARGDLYLHIDVRTS
jgi:molecular chaperone DnaJ